MSKTVKILISIGLFVLLFGGIAMSLFSRYTEAYNRNVQLTTIYTQKINERSSYYDNFTKITKQKGIVASKNDTGFMNVVKVMMDGQKDGQNVTWKWVQQSNPAATYSEVAALYKDLSRQIEADRKSLVELEKSIQSIVQQQDELTSTFWNANFFLKGVHKLKDDYRPITSTRMENINKTGKDDDISVF